MDYISGIFSNFNLLSVGIAWMSAQIIKIFTGYFQDEHINLRKLLFGTGGMPSSHSATVVALMVSVAMKEGTYGFNFAISCLLAIIVMSDAVGVRYETGKQARLLNKMVEELFSSNHENVNAKLKELIGHTPLQVFMGAILGVVVPVLLNLIIG